jgi:hypothetical protein
MPCHAHTAGQESALQTSLTLDTRSVFTSYCHNSEHPADATFNVKASFASRFHAHSSSARLVAALQPAAAHLAHESYK